MYNLLLADDEELERRAIKSIINKRFENMFNIYEARNGREAIEIADRVKPDILIMDIKMPGINGIEAIKEIRRFLQEGYFIILTAYDYFDYAREAIEYNVKEYLLKPLKREEFLNKLEGAIRYIDELKAKRRDEIVLKEKIYNMLPMMENELCYSIINDTLVNIDYKTHLEYLGMEFKFGYSMVVGFKETHSNEKSELKFKINDYIREYVKRNNNAISSCIFTNEIIIFVEVDENHMANQNEHNIMSFSRRALEDIKERFNIDVFIGVGRVYGGIENLTQSYTEAVLAFDNTSKEASIKHFLDLSEEKLTDDFNLEERTKMINKYREVVEAGNNFVLRAEEYIKDNYNKDITLDEVAGYVNISSFYFSKVFKDYTGKNYVDYITDLRIDKAKEMLADSGLSIKEICYEVGYNDPNYFSRVFKKVEGLSPSEYKSRL